VCGVAPHPHPHPHLTTYCSCRAAVTITLNDDKSDVEVRVEASATVANGKQVDITNKRARVVLEKKGAFKLGYGVTNEALCLELNSAVKVNDTNVDLTYTAAGNKNSLKAEFDVSDDASAVVAYDLSGWTGLDADRVTAGLKYKVNDDTKAETHFNVGSKTNTTSVTYRLDDSNELKATAHLNFNNNDVFEKLNLRLKNSSDVLGKGQLTAEASIATSGAVNFNVNKEWELDL
jgi:hypothetical protein